MRFAPFQQEIINNYYSLLFGSWTPHLTLAQCALCAVFNPGGAAEAWDVVLVCARLGDVVADGVGLAGVSDTAGAALALWHHGELTVHRRAGQRPAVHLSLLRGTDGENITWFRDKDAKTERNLRKYHMFFWCFFTLTSHLFKHISPDCALACQRQLHDLVGKKLLWYQEKK